MSDKRKHGKNLSRSGRKGSLEGLCYKTKTGGLKRDPVCLRAGISQAASQEAEKQARALAQWLELLPAKCLSI